MSCLSSPMRTPDSLRTKNQTHASPPPSPPHHQDPKRAPIALFASNAVGIVWTICWWLVAYCPGGYVERLTKQWYIQVRPH